MGLTLVVDLLEFINKVFQLQYLERINIVEGYCLLAATIQSYTTTGVFMILTEEEE
jgi:hypothetical protein